MKNKLTYQNDTINFFKGVLILLVVMGHLMSGGKLTELLLRYIYVFHMALFFGISGYLIKIEYFKKNIYEVFSKYFTRIILPFLIASIIYSIFNQEIINLAYPWFHLWFIPAFVIFVIYLFIIVRININLKFFVLLATFITLLFTYNFGYGSGEEVMNYIGDKRYYYYFSFFLLGIFLRNNEYYNKVLIIISILIIIICSYIILWTPMYTKNSLISSIVFIVFNYSLIYLIVLIFNRYKKIKLNIINWLGENTLIVYLYHVIPLIIVERYLNLAGWNRILVYFCLFCIFFFLLNWLKKINFIKNYIYGEKV